MEEDSTNPQIQLAQRKCELLNTSVIKLQLASKEYNMYWMEGSVTYIQNLNYVLYYLYYFIVCNTTIGKCKSAPAESVIVVNNT